MREETRPGNLSWETSGPVRYGGLDKARDGGTGEGRPDPGWILNRDWGGGGQRGDLNQDGFCFGAQTF